MFLFIALLIAFKAESKTRFVLGVESQYVPSAHPLLGALGWALATMSDWGNEAGPSAWPCHVMQSMAEGDQGRTAIAARAQPLSVGLFWPVF